MGHTCEPNEIIIKEKHPPEKHSFFQDDAHESPEFGPHGVERALRTNDYRLRSDALCTPLCTCWWREGTGFARQA